MVATPQPSPRRRPIVVPTPPPPGRGAGIMTLPTPRPTAVQRAMANRRPIREPRSLAETFAEGAQVMQGVGAGMLAGLAGLPADLTALAFGDIPAIVNKLVTGESINQEESPYFQQLNEFRDTYGAEAVLRAMGLGDKLDAPSDSDDALSRAGINPFRQGAFAGEFLADPLLFLKAGKVAKAGLTGAGSRSTNALADAAAGDAAARAAVDQEYEELFGDDAPQTGSIVSTQPQVGFTGQVETPPEQTAAEMVIEGTATEIPPNFADDAMDVVGGRPSTQTPAGAPRMPEDGPDPVELIDPYVVMPMTASRDEVARITPPIRPMEMYSRARPPFSVTQGVTVTPAERRFIEESRAGSAVDYSPLFQIVNDLPDNEAFSKSQALSRLRAGSKESVEKDRRGSGFIEFLEKFGPGTLTRGEVLDLYRKYTPQVRVRSVTQSEVEADVPQDALVTGPPIASLPDFRQKTFDGGTYGIRVPSGLTFKPEKLHVYFANPNSQLPLDADGSRTLQLQSYSDHSFGIAGGVGRMDVAVGRKETGVPGYYGHARFNAIENDRGRIAVFQEGQSNQGVKETAAGKGEIFVNYTDNTLEAIGRQTRDGEEYTVVRLDKIEANPTFGINTEFKGKVTDPNTGEAIPRGTQIVFPGISRPRTGLRRSTLQPGVPQPVGGFSGARSDLEDVLRVLRYFPEGREFLENNPEINFNRQAVRDVFKSQRVRTSKSQRSDLVAPEFERLRHASSSPSAYDRRDPAVTPPGLFMNKIRGAYPDFTSENRIRSITTAESEALEGRPAAEQLIFNIRDNQNAPLADLIPEGYRPFRFNQGVTSVDGRDFDAGDLILVPESFATETGRTGQPLITELLQRQTDRMLPDAQIEEIEIKTGEGPKTPVVVPFTGEERRLLEDLRGISSETSRIFDETVNSSVVRADDAADPFIEKFFEGQREADEIFQQFEDDRLIIGGSIPTATETRGILDAVNQNMTAFEPVAGGFREMTDLILDVAPTRLAQLMERLDDSSMTQRIMVEVPGHPDTIGISPRSLTLYSETMQMDSLTNHDLATLLLSDGLSPEQINKFNSGFLARIEDIDARNPTSDTDAGRQAFFVQEGGDPFAYHSYQDIIPEFTRFDEGDPAARSPHQYFREVGPVKLTRFMREDPGLFGHMTSPKINGPDAPDFKPLNETSSDPRLIMSRAMKHRIKVALDEKLDDAINARRPQGDQTLRDDVPLEESIKEMNRVIDGGTFPPVSDARKKEFKEAFETYANTVHRAGKNPRSFDPLPGDRAGQNRIYTVSTPFVGRNSTSDNARHMYRVAIAEVEAAGFDGAVFPHWEDQFDARRNQGFKKPAAQRVYETELMAALKEAGYKVKTDNRGPADVVIEPTIMAKNQTTGVVEPLPVSTTGDNHRPAIAIYFNQDRVRTRRYPRDERPATGEQTYEESIGTNRDMLVNPDGTRKLVRRAKGGPVDLRPKKLIHSGIGGMARQVM